MMCRVFGRLCASNRLLRVLKRDLKGNAESWTWEDDLLSKGSFTIRYGRTSFALRLSCDRSNVPLLLPHRCCLHGAVMAVVTARAFSVAQKQFGVRVV